jgi:hypothetical protein
MKRKLLIGVGVVVALFAGLFLYATLVGNKRSPAQTVALNQGGVDMKVTYCRPYKKGRVIFGEKESGALVPYGKYWRLGANAATEITFSKKVSFSGKPVEAGSYRMYAIPGATSWQVVLNSQIGKWGAFEADHSKDVLTVEVPASVAAAETEQFTIGLNGGPAAAQMDFVWDKTAVHVPIAPL